ncbi:FmdB family zinc ribbon protein [Rhodopirellula sp. SWK7]|uniref:FmdB family zinc ribbon protein n=1 Tax=Rhodopirellula sp. SWK7 TaxID=595460 RepID=UPI0002BE6EA7|nr:zinc ribbon domain-containing protein [Rhodopirellula sp. SWK7]EMI47426.1 Regulatory protein, FmdB, putative domain protein [Rhodopirellula sp. SWK7]
MPLYEYECDHCHETKEILVRNPDEKAACPDCGSEKIQRLLSVPAAPSMGRSLPVSGGGMPESCAQPRCCGGGCQI